MIRSHQYDKNIKPQDFIEIAATTGKNYLFLSKLVFGNCCSTDVYHKDTNQPWNMSPESWPALFAGKGTSAFFYPKGTYNPVLSHTSFATNGILK